MGRLDVETVFLLRHEEAICLFAQVPPACSHRKSFAAPPAPGPHRWYIEALCKIFSELLFAVPSEAFWVPILAPLRQNLEVCERPWGISDGDPSGGSEDNYDFSIRHPRGGEVGIRVPSFIALYA